MPSSAEIAHQQALDSAAERHAAEIDRLKASLMVLDATIYMVVSAWDTPELQDLFRSQIETAKRTYEEATGAESLIGFKREVADG